MKIFNHLNIIEGQGTPMRRERLDPRNFPPARNIPLHPMPRVNSASSVTEDMPLTPDEHRRISDIAQYESKFSVAQKRVEDVLQGKDAFLRMTIDRRLRSYFELNKALQATSAGGVEGGRIIEGVAQGIEQARLEAERHKREGARQKSKTKREKGAVKASSGYESPTATTGRAIKEWGVSDEKGDEVERKNAQKFLKKKKIRQEGDVLALAIQAGYEPKNPSLNNYIEGALERQAKRNEELVEIATVHRKEIDARFKSDFKKEIDHAFSVMPADILSKEQYKGMNVGNYDDREKIVMSEGYEPESANPHDIKEETSAEKILAMATKQGMFDGKKGRKHQYASRANADQWRDDVFSAYDKKESIGSRRESASQGTDSRVIATGKRGGKIVGYRSDGSPIYQKGTDGSQTTPKKASTQQDTKPTAPSEEGFRAVKRNSPMDTTKLETPSSLSKTLEVASMFAESVLKKRVENGQMKKGEEEALIDALDDAYERLIHIRPLLNRHHTPHHNEIVHMLREAHANPEKDRVNHVIELTEHFIESVCKESKLKSKRAEEAIYRPKSKTTKKAMIKIGDKGLVVSDLHKSRLEAVKEQIKIQEGAIFEHNMSAPPSQQLDMSVVKSCFTRSSSIPEAMDRVYALTQLAKGESVTSEDADLLGDLNPNRLKGQSVRSLLKSESLSDEEILDLVIKGVVSDEEGDDKEVDDDEFETDQEQLEEEVSYGVNPDREDDDDDEVEKGAPKTVSDLFEELKARSKV